MKEFLAGAGLVLLVVFAVIVISKLMKKTKKREKKERLYSNERDLIGYYVGHPNMPSPRFVTPLRPNVYFVPKSPVVVQRPRRVRRLFW